MNITILQVGKTKQSFWSEAEKEYLKRLGPYARMEVVTVKEAELPKGDIGAGRKLVKTKEAKELLAHLQKGDFVVALDEKGKEYGSQDFAGFLGGLRDRGSLNLVFIIGGPYGLAEEVLNRSDLKIALSRLTFTHEMARVILLEQVYRAFTILQGKTYHY